MHLPNGPQTQPFNNRGVIAGIILGILIMSVFMSVIIFIMMNTRVALNSPPVDYVWVTPLWQGPVCPGENISLQMYIAFERDALITTYTAFRDPVTKRNFPNTNVTYPVRIQAGATAFTDTFTVTVPSLAPGLYQYVRASVAVNEDTRPAFMTLPVEVKRPEECP